MRVRLCRLGFALCVASLGMLGMGSPPERTLPVDPVELVAGREVPGKPELVIEREGFEYRFATPQNKAAFEKEPEKFEVADGGACGSMGPLSGLGDARRYAVHDGRIYFFASDGCRARFLKEPGACIETADEKPFGSNEQVLAGWGSLKKLIAWAGGDEKLKSVKSYHASSARTEKQGEKDWQVTDEFIIEFPNKYFHKQAWNESWFSTVSGPDGGAMASRRGQERIGAGRARAFDRWNMRSPIVLLKAAADGTPAADCPGLIVIGDGAGELDGVPVEFVKVWLNGAGSRLTIDPSTGKLLALSFRGRDNTLRVGESTRRFTAYETVDGLTLPTAYSVVLDGKEIPSAGGKIDTFEINGAVPPDTFRIETE